jgi:hypothetical protein
MEMSNARSASAALRGVSQDDDLFLANFVDGDRRERGKRDLTRASNATNASEVWKRFQCPDALDHRLRDSSRGLRTAFGNVVADPLEIVRGIGRPADAHQPR